ncbi:hypothetical protein UA08_08117 [Talaromyces atroroseus]|uniref:Zn(2)-C6 fungal-type domain-containing protein n=1 Tax=Talaromyces atroroseus TaxID=1441469 RepID=A0A225AC60_TALAT|nr:hypothetical protein UA08_08117 [Talaromyces atroroseus]OKL56423.1 hypothetical protein UA08_08117 [Talaromyces atroroseus]
MAEQSNGSTTNGVNAPPTTKTKRSRVQFSCTACRYRKLKCDRTYPCDRCTRRGDAASCTYVGHGPRTRANHLSSGSNPSHIQDRIQHLENLILSFAQKRRQEDESRDDTTASSAATHSARDAVALATEQSTALEDDPGKLVNNEQAGTTQIDEHDLLNDDSTDEMVKLEHEANRPTLLFHGGRVPTKQELIAELPDRSTVDRLMGRLLNSEDPTLDPAQVSLPWLGFLYACMAMAVGMFRRSLEQPPAPLGNAAVEISRLERNCCYCLINSNYLTVGKYKVEALLIYATIEFTKRGNSAMSVSIILGITIKLAMRMGYHRDAKHYDNISALEGEMRRRVWATICQLDTLTAFQAGIPRQTQTWQSDTELPRNISDEEFDENSIELPPSKPDSIRTQTTYLRSKSRVMSAFGQICDLAYSRHPIIYETILELDRKLEEAHELIAPPLRMRPLNQSVTDHSGLIMKRYTLEVLYQKARIVLHRKYLVEARYNPLLSYSRSVCVKAAKAILRQQYDLFYESQVGGRLERDNWFFRSLQNHDFVLAAMVICLELFKYNETVSTAEDVGPQPRQPQSQQEPPSTAADERNNLIETLRKSREIWKANLMHSMEARKAFSALTFMLKKAELDDEARKSNSQSPVQPNAQSSLLPNSNSTPNASPDVLRTAGSPSDDITIGESALSRRFGGINGQALIAYLDNFLSPSNLPTPPKSNSTGNNTLGTAGTPSAQTGITNNNTINNNIQQQPRHASIPALDAFQQQYPSNQSSLVDFDMIQNMLDTPQNLDWQLWDGQMQDDDPGFMNEFWNPAGIIPSAGTMEVDGQNNASSNGSNNTNANTNDGNRNGSGNQNGDNWTSTNLVGLYIAPGYRG